MPKLRDGLGWLYLEHGRIERTQKAVEFIDLTGRTHIPAAALAVVMLGPGTSITHEAVKTLADNGCLVNWCGEAGVRFYAQGVGETRKGYKLVHQAELVSMPEKRLQVVRRMYAARFDDDLGPGLTLEQIRGKEGARVRQAYNEAAIAYGVRWYGRNYNRQAWGASDSVNRALSTANACLNGLCHAAIVSAGYSPGLGFIHTGKQLSFVYDIADLYKTRLTVPLAFQLAAESPLKLESRVRHACRDLFHARRLLGRIIDDIELLLNLTRSMPSLTAWANAPVNSTAREGANAMVDEEAGLPDYDGDQALPGALWSPTGEDPGGINYGDVDTNPSALTD
ncbi:MAG: type I-E CRISPR-associated endonuclease Cas1e [Litorilinea sp.]